MGMGKCGKIPVQLSTDTEEQPPSLKKTRIENFEELCDLNENVNPVPNELAECVNLKMAKNIGMMQFWSDLRTQLQFPELCAVASRVLCSYFKPLRKRFNAGRRVLDKRRTSHKFSVYITIRKLSAVSARQYELVT